MDVKLTLDAQAMQSISHALADAAADTVEALHTEVLSAQVMPFDTGDMQNNQTFVAAERAESAGLIRATLITGSPQARRLYYHPEYHFQHAGNPNAGGRWLDPWLTGAQKDFLPTRFAGFLRARLNKKG